MRQMEDKVGSVGARLRLNGVGRPVVASLFADDTILLAESSKEFQKAVD